MDWQPSLTPSGVQPTLLIKWAGSMKVRVMGILYYLAMDSERAFFFFFNSASLKKHPHLSSSGMGTQYQTEPSLISQVPSNLLATRALWFPSISVADKIALSYTFRGVGQFPDISRQKPVITWVSVWVRAENMLHFLNLLINTITNLMDAFRCLKAKGRSKHACTLEQLLHF